MKILVKGMLCAMLSVVSLSSLALPNAFDCWLTDENMKYYVMLEIREKYQGICLCPHDLDAKGNRCGLKSAFKQPSSNVAALCKSEQVLDALVTDYRERHCPPSNSVLADWEETQN